MGLGKISKLGWRGIMKIQRLSASNFKFYSPRGKVVVVDAWLTGDPFWPQAEKTPEKLAEIDVLAITHAHFDHAAGIDEIAKQNEKVSIIAQYEFAFSLIGRGIKNVVPTSFGGTVEIQGMKFSAVPAFHTSSIMDSQLNSQIVGMPMGYVIEFEDGRKVYASGDTGLDRRHEVRGGRLLQAGYLNTTCNGRSHYGAGAGCLRG